MWEEEIVLDTIYDFDYTLYRLSFDPTIAVNQEKRKLAIPFVKEKEKHIIYIEALGTTKKPHFMVKSKDSSIKSEILEYIFETFQWNKDLTTIQNHFHETNIAELFNKYPGTPIVREFDLYYSLMKTIIHQQLNMKFAYVLSTRFVERFGEKVEDVWFYPTPEIVADIQVEDLRKMQFSRRKAEYIIDTSKLIVNRELDLEGLSQKNDKEIISELTKIRGIGRWTAENWMMFGLGRDDHFPKADIGIQNAVKIYLGLDRKPTKEELIDLSIGWEPYRSYASLILWRSIE